MPSHFIAILLDSYFEWVLIYHYGKQGDVEWTLQEMKTSAFSRRRPEWDYNPFELSHVFFLSTAMKYCQSEASSDSLISGFGEVINQILEICRREYRSLDFAALVTSLCSSCADPAPKEEKSELVFWLKAARSASSPDYPFHAVGPFFRKIINYDLMFLQK
jgi:hypothetical protein